MPNQRDKNHPISLGVSIRVAVVFLVVVRVFIVFLVVVFFFLRLFSQAGNRSRHSIGKVGIDEFWNHSAYFIP